MALFWKAPAEHVPTFFALALTGRLAHPRHPKPPGPRSLSEATDSEPQVRIWLGVLFCGRPQLFMWPAAAACYHRLGLVSHYTGRRIFAYSLRRFVAYWSRGQLVLASILSCSRHQAIVECTMLPAFVFSPLSAGNKPRRVPNPAGLLYSKPRRGLHPVPKTPS